MIVLLLFLLYAVVLSLALGRSGCRLRPPTSPSAPRGKPERILIVGATGGTGRQLVEQALERGYMVTAFARDPSKILAGHPRLTIARGDVLDADSVAAAVRGQGAVVCALGHNKYAYPTRILSEGTRNILRAMEAHRVPRLVCETSLGIGSSAGRMGLYYSLIVIPLVLPFYFWDKVRQERVIAASSVDWVIVRPGALTNDGARGRYRHGPRVGNPVWTVRISRTDVADFMLNQLESDSYLHTAPGICW